MSNELSGKELAKYAATKPIRGFSNIAATETIEHLRMVRGKVARGNGEPRTICVLMSYLWYTESDPDRKLLLLEAAWMARRMWQGLERAKRGKRGKRGKS